jgi:putative oxygen-independent coproporphyrinogen III oxidase
MAARMLQFNEPPPLSLYVHIPWCICKCPYCDFNSHAVRTTVPEHEYLGALVADLEQDLRHLPTRVIETVFIGGGTPSVLSARTIENLLTAIRSRVPCDSDMEVTLEANPGTADRERFAAFRSAGVTRLSIGVQSFSDDSLQRIGRIHGAADALHAVDAAHSAGFESLNLDLMYGLPGQSMDQALADLKTAIGLAPHHLSWYQLTVEPNTPFYHQPPPLPDDDELWHLHCEGRAVLEAAGYPQYEVSAFARPGHACRHNLNYWQFGDYLGIGAGAHGKITHTGEGTITRYWKRRHPGAYLKGRKPEGRIGGSTVLDIHDVTLEFAMNALRLNSGFTAAQFTDATGLALEWIAKPLMDGVDRGLLQQSGNIIRTTPAGRRYLNSVLELFLSGQDHHARDHIR